MKNDRIKYFGHFVKNTILCTKNKSINIEHGYLDFDIAMKSNSKSFCKV